MVFFIRESSICEKRNSMVFVALGKAKWSKKLAVVNFPGMPILRFSISSILIYLEEINIGPQLFPKALPACNNW